MSKQRAVARAERRAAAITRAEAERAAQAKTMARRSRRERRSQTWRRLRLWQHGPSFHRRRETIGALCTLVLATLLLVYLFTGSVTYVVVTALVFVVAGPMLVLLFFDRRGS
ncbi:MAG: hypothetical protein M3070_06530 [Actinomycetota bacterium]|nr:hypothetical protein [Actinomycetota bacterium]